MGSLPEKEAKELLLAALLLLDFLREFEDDEKPVDMPFAEKRLYEAIWEAEFAAP